MEETDQTHIKEVLKRIIWDYNIDVDELYSFITGEGERLYHFDREKIHIRIMERLNWYEILECLPMTEIKMKRWGKSITS